MIGTISNQTKKEKKKKEKIGTISINQTLIENLSAQLILEYLHVRITRCMCILAMATFCFAKSKFHQKKELQQWQLAYCQGSPRQTNLNCTTPMSYKEMQMQFFESFYKIINDNNKYAVLMVLFVDTDRLHLQLRANIQEKIDQRRNSTPDMHQPVCTLYLCRM